MTAGDGTIGKAVEVMDRVAEMKRPVKFSEILDRCSFPKATLYRYLQSLTNQNLLSYDEANQTYSFGLRVMSYAHVAWKFSSLAPIARRFAEGLALQSKMTVHVGQLDNGHVLYVDKVDARDPMRLNSQIGKIAPAYCTGIGKAMLAFQNEEDLADLLSQQSYYRHTEKTVRNRNELMRSLEVIRSDGVALDDQEHETGVICIACPVLSTDQTVFGGLSLTTNIHTHTSDELKTHIPLLKEAAQNLGSAFEAWRYPQHE